MKIKKRESKHLGGRGMQENVRHYSAENSKIIFIWDIELLQLISCNMKPTGYNAFCRLIRRRTEDHKVLSGYWML